MGIKINFILRGWANALLAGGVSGGADSGRNRHVGVAIISGTAVGPGGNAEKSQYGSSSNVLSYPNGQLRVGMALGQNLGGVGIRSGSPDGTAHLSSGGIVTGEVRGSGWPIYSTPANHTDTTRHTMPASRINIRIYPSLQHTARPSCAHWAAKDEDRNRFTNGRHNYAIGRIFAKLHEAIFLLMGGGTFPV